MVGAGEFLKEFIGPSLYGAGGFIDPVENSRLYYQGMEFAFNWTSGEWKVKRILTRDQPAFGKIKIGTMSGQVVSHPVYLNGRQYMVTDPNSLSNELLLLIGEFRKDRVVPLTVVGNAEAWTPFQDDPALRQLVADRPLNTLSFTWSDQNGDGLPQPGEVELISPEKRLDATYWPTRVNNRLELQLGGRLLKPVAFTACVRRYTNRSKCRR